MTEQYHPTNTGFRRRLSLWLRGFPGSRYLPWRYLVVDTASAADEVPDELKARTAVVVRSGGRATWLVFDCPRHPDERIMLNLSTRRRPYWSIVDELKLSVYPSVDALHAGSRCHFWIRLGRLRWDKEVKLETGINR